ncbi:MULTISPECIES: thiolase family protein [Bradyrhizobium]|jgi:acetyl-CoA acetyltransferase|uniref:Acetyl-CoA acetyltransferase n=1 Tax=Bradyrhizobium elkanii TaxID=29448 RepID=A0ABV4F7P8_BRAEL|nr:MULTISPECIES: thiolase family protein [Bradyrhizobium]MCA1396241.1 thiolase family protein [Bradyrhizobium sp. BRP56]MCP1751055.1 acetyl-CoA acetyltransferase [Bradyrhizobium elkanii]MCP1976827.1 acetyl-CoA acetyltransferase [Bradyrhizobium elkanii]MCS3447202.1 acetyl-CoA acetyltransferase [Bradyrhizobium elkanii]MCS3561662.1 acetyl-CoA acetyltransferase [Bradyrhizobium elkanii]
MRDVAIVGYSETKIDVRTGRTSYELAGDALDEILVRTNVDKSEIDGLSVSETMSESANPFWAQYMADVLGISPSWLELMGLGGVSSIGGVARAAMAIRGGMCSIALVLAADAQSSGATPEQGAQRHEFQYPTGLRGPVGAFGMIMRRYDHLYGLNRDALAKLAVTQRQHSILNDNACPRLRKPMTEHDYLNSKLVSDPLRVLDSVMVCDGANAVLVMSAAEATRRGLKAVYPTGYAERTHYKVTEPMTEIMDSGFLEVGPRALKQAGLEASDIQSFHPYDDFIIAIMLQLEQIGFCPQGAGADFVLSRDMTFKGDLPLNTGGGQISAGQPGLAGGGLNLVEAVRQMFGDGGPRQIKRTRNAMVTGIGGIPYARNWCTSGVMILEQ